MFTTMVRDGDTMTPAQRLLARGGEALTVIELFAVAAGVHDDASMEKIRAAVSAAGSIRAAVTEGAGLKGARRARLLAAVELAKRSAWEELAAKPALLSPRDSAAFLNARMQHLPYEVFAALFLDNRHRVLSYEEMFRGTLDGASVHPREVVRAALNHNAAAVILAHNHPSGVSEPSAADRNITHQLRDALQLIGVRVLDHLVIGAGEPTSMAARGLI